MSKSRGASRRAAAASGGVAVLHPLQSTDNLNDGVSWDGKNIRVDRGENDGAIKRVFGRELSDAQLVALVGAPDGSDVSISSFTTEDDHGKREYISIRTSNEFYSEAQSRLVFKEAGQTVIKNDLFMVKDSAPAGIGTRVLAREVVAARKLGINTIQTFAARYISPKGTSNYYGYKVWPKLGFDTLISNIQGQYRGSVSGAEVLREAGSRSGARTLQDLLSTPNGRALWDLHGAGTLMYFDTRVGSRNSNILRSYMTAKGYKVKGF